MKRPLGWLVLASIALASLGCRNGLRRPGESQPSAPPSARPVSPPPNFQPAPAAFPTNPASPNLPPPLPPPSAPPTLPPTGAAAEPSKEALRHVDSRWQPAEPGIQLGAPEPIPDAAPKSTPQLGPPEKEPPAATPPRITTTSPARLSAPRACTPPSFDTLGG